MIFGDFDFKRYIQDMSEDKLIAFAERAGTTKDYIKNHLIYRKKMTSPALIDALVIASQGDFNKAQYVSWLYNLAVEAS